MMSIDEIVTAIKTNKNFITEFDDVDFDSFDVKNEYYFTIADIENDFKNAKDVFKAVTGRDYDTTFASFNLDSETAIYGMEFRISFYKDTDERGYSVGIVSEDLRNGSIECLDSFEPRNDEDRLVFDALMEYAKAKTN